MLAITHTPQSRAPGTPAYYHARPARWPITALHRQAHQLFRALTRHSRRLHPVGSKLGPMPRMRWYT